MNHIEIFVLAAMIFLLLGRFVVPTKLKEAIYLHKYLVPLTLFALWWGLTIYQSYIIENVFTILTDQYSAGRNISVPSGELFSGQKISGFFTASHNYLGIIGFRFWTFYRLNSDHVQFRIKEQGKPDWYYSGEYKTDQFQPNQYFPFGFPNINNSQGKTYKFEITSLNGQPKNSVGASSIQPYLIVKYKFPRQVVTQSVSSLAKFAKEKIDNLVSNSTFTASSFIYLLPFLVYVIFISKIKESFFSKKINRLGVYLRANKKSFSIILNLIGLYVDIIYIRTGDIAFFVLIATFTYMFLAYSIHNLYLFVLGWVCLMTSALYLYLGQDLSSERSAAWAWIFLIAWLIIQIKQTPRQKKYASL